MLGVMTCFDNVITKFIYDNKIVFLKQKDSGNSVAYYT